MTKKAPRPLCVIYANRSVQKGFTLLCVRLGRMPLDNMYELSARILGERHPVENWNDLKRPLRRALYNAIRGEEKCIGIAFSDKPYTFDIEIHPDDFDEVTEGLRAFFEELEIRTKVSL